LAKWKKRVRGHVLTRRFHAQALYLFLFIFDQPQSGITPPAVPLPSAPFKFMANVKGNLSCRSFAISWFLRVPDTQYNRNTLILLSLPALVFRTLIYLLRWNAVQFFKTTVARRKGNFRSFA